MSTDHAARFHDLHHAPASPLLLPNAWDFASAAALAGAGFAAIGTTSLGVNSAHGLPDARGAGRAPAVALARLLVKLPCPVTVDIEAGFSDDPGAVADLAAELAGFGVAGVNLEDGRGGGALAEPGTQAALIRAVKARAPRLFVNARIDTHWLRADPPPTAVTRDRAERYLAAGADGIFVPGLSGDGDIATLAAAVAAPLNILFDPRRHTFDRLAALGVRRISTGSLLFRGAVHAAVTLARAVRDGDPVPRDLPTYADLQRLTGDAGVSRAAPPPPPAAPPRPAGR
ncbi:isocitrate lyase/PEP mutase family protein [Qaidamihabitans albus]|uniref:isocitrate lyase/PEP mutase family protein n=1 Tax=Qaidamihabitans albus TaxID=2795733 RepID=UPI0018F26AA2|nr:isocitrate lyase/phosphoenolpyruvate mutase family protein [Qaidamihabitans albus]